MTDLYRTLGIRKTATPAAIEKAYRRRAKATHPDRGGDRAEFERCDLAYRVLTNPDTRARYDATGEVCPPRPDEAVARTMGVLSVTLTLVLQEVLRQGGDVAGENMVAHMRAVLEAQLDGARKGRAAAEKGRAALGFVATRFNRKGGENLLEAVARDQMGRLEAQLQSIDADIAGLEAAAKELAEYSYDFQKTFARWATVTT